MGRSTAVLILAAAALVLSCPVPSPERAAVPAPDRLEWSLALHGGAGTVPRDDEREAYRESLSRALALGREMLSSGRSSLDTAEAVVRLLEDDPLFNAGRGAVFNHEGRHELDASVMDGRTLAAGAVAGVSTVRHPVSLARLVMEKTRHVLLAGAGAEAFADETGVERVPNAWFNTERRREAWRRYREQASADRPTGTVGCVALDRAGHLAAATSTGGITGKRFGRVGDTPIVGAGCYADDRTCAVSATGRGEEFIRHAVAFHIAALMRYAGKTVDQAAREVVQEILRPDMGGVIAVDGRGRTALEFNTAGMLRGAADSSGRFEVAPGGPP